MSVRRLAGGSDAPPHGAAPSAVTGEPVADDPRVVALQGLVERVNAYGLHPELMAYHAVNDRRMRMRGLLVSAVMSALLVWCVYFVVVVAMRVNVWPFS